MAWSICSGGFREPRPKSRPKAAPAPKCAKASRIIQARSRARRRRSCAVIARDVRPVARSLPLPSSFSASPRSQIATGQQNRAARSQQTRDKAIRRQIETLAQQLSWVPPLFAFFVLRYRHIRKIAEGKTLSRPIGEELIWNNSAMRKERVLTVRVTFGLPR